MKRHVLFVAIAALCGVMAASTLAVAADPVVAPPVAAKPAKELSADQVKALIAKLGDADFKTRAAAQKELVEAGPAALPALEEAAKSSDAEIKQRAADAIKEIKNALAMAASAEAAKNYLWAFNIDNGAMTGPAVFGNRAFVVGRDGKVYAVDTKTGKKAWDADLPNKAQAQISANDKVVSVMQGANLTVYDAKEGKKLWAKELGAGAAGPGVQPPVVAPPVKGVPLQGGGAASVPAAGPAGPPVAKPGVIMAAGPMPFPGFGRAAAWVVGDLVVARAGDKLKAFKALTGEDAWEMEFKVTPGAFCNTIAADNVLYASKNTAVVAIDLAAHKELWSADISNCAGMALGGGTVCCVVGSKIVALDAKKGDKLWEADMPNSGAGVAAPVGRLVLRNRGSEAQILPVDDSRVYMVMGDELVTLDLKKGDKSTVKLDLSVPQTEETGPATGGPAGGPGGGATIVINGGGAVIAPGGGAGISNMAGMLMNRWIVSGDKLYVSTSNGLFAFEAKTGQRLWMLPTRQMLAGDPVVADGVIYFATAPSYGAAKPDEKALPKDLPGLHAVKLQK